jgi:hypothetical protein
VSQLLGAGFDHKLSKRNVEKCQKILKAVEETNGSVQGKLVLSGDWVKADPSPVQLSIQPLSLESRGSDLFWQDWECQICSFRVVTRKLAFAVRHEVS